MPSTVIENYEPSDEGWGVVLGPLRRDSSDTPSEPQSEENSSAAEDEQADV